MIVISENKVVFAEVERMLHALHDGDSSYDDTVVVLGYNVAKYLPQDLRDKYPGKKIVVYQLEQLFDGSKWVNQHMANWLNGADAIWEYDLSNLAWLKRNGFDAEYRPMCYSDALRDISMADDRDIDILFYGYPTPRRMRIMAYLMGCTWTSKSLIWATGVSGAKLRDLISRAKVILNVHAFDKECRQEQVRLFYPIINGACVISEKSPHNEFGKSVIVSDIGNMPKFGATITHVLDKGIWKQFGSDAPEVYKRHCEERNGCVPH